MKESNLSRILDGIIKEYQEAQILEEQEQRENEAKHRAIEEKIFDYNEFVDYVCLSHLNPVNKQSRNDQEALANRTVKKLDYGSRVANSIYRQIWLECKERDERIEGSIACMEDILDSIASTVDGIEPIGDDPCLELNIDFMRVTLETCRSLDEELEKQYGDACDTVPLPTLGLSDIEELAAECVDIDRLKTIYDSLHIDTRCSLIYELLTKPHSGPKLIQPLEGLLAVEIPKTIIDDLPELLEYPIDVYRAVKLLKLIRTYAKDLSLSLAAQDETWKNRLVEVLTNGRLNTLDRGIRRLLSGYVEMLMN